MEAPPPIDGLVHADALEEAHREVPDRPWGRVALIALVLTALMIAGWEGFWRSRQYMPGDVKDTYAGWSEQRRHATGDAVVLIGTSRNLYDVDLDVFQKTTGVRPVQLSLAGTSPRFVLADLADDPKFHGLVISDMVTGMFYTTFDGRGAAAVPYYHKETPSQRAGFFLAYPSEYAFGYIDDQTRPKEMWRRVSLPLRPGQRPAFVDPYKLETAKPDRNTELWGRLLTDEEYRQRAIGIWAVLFRPPPGAPPPNPPKVIAEVAANVAKIRARGGNVIFVMHPQGGFLEKGERHAFPRAVFWDGLLEKTGTKGVRYDDYPQLQGFRLPELSHMHPRDAEVYTARLAPMLLKADAETRKKPATAR